MDREGLMAIIVILAIAIFGAYYYKTKVVNVPPAEQQQSQPQQPQWNQWQTLPN